jgi:pantetheine-phosphate adenylyltransferase
MNKAANSQQPAANSQLPTTNCQHRTGVFVGSFDPFTIGHADIVNRALPLFDRIVIGVGVNERKQYMLTADERCRRISLLYKDEPKIEVQTYDDLTASFAHRAGARYIIKGVRTMKDFEYEREQADINRRIGDVETLLLYADPRYESISSSMVRELIHFGKDVKDFLP